MAGTGEVGSSGDGRAALGAKVAPRALAVAPNGDVYFTEASGEIRVIDHQTKTVSEFARLRAQIPPTSNGGCNGFPAGGPTAIAIGKSGDLYVGDNSLHVVTKINIVTRAQTVVAGDGIEGLSQNGTDATDSSLGNSYSLAIRQDGRLLIADSDNDRIREVRNGRLYTVAGNSSAGDMAGDGRDPRDAHLNEPNGVAALEGEDFVIADTFNHRVRRVSLP